MFRTKNSRITNSFFFLLLTASLIKSPSPSTELSPKKIESKMNSFNLFLKELTKCMDYLDEAPIILKKINYQKLEKSEKARLLEEFKGNISKNCTQTRFKLLGTKSGISPEKTCEISLKRYMENLF